MGNALDALRALTSNADNAGSPVQGYVNEQRRLQEMKRNLELAQGSKTFGTGATQGDVADAELDLSSDPDMGDEAHQQTAQAQALNEGIQTYNRPDVTAMRQTQEADALKKMLAPIALKGQYEVEAAKQSQIGHSEQQERAIEARAALEDRHQEGLAGRATANNESMVLRQRLQALQTGKAHAASPGGLSGFFSSQKSLDDAEIAHLMQQILGSEPGSAAPAATAAGPHRPTAEELLRKYGG